MTIVNINTLKNNHSKTNNSPRGGGGSGGSPINDSSSSSSCGVSLFRCMRKMKKLTYVVFVFGWMIAFGIGKYWGEMSYYFLISSNNNGGGSCGDVNKKGSKSNKIKTNAKQKLSEVITKYGKVERIAVVGERNSGTSWMIKHLQDCFESSEFTVTPGITRDKHWFQGDFDTNPRKSTVVLVMVRNPYDWILAMRKRPHHAPLHLHIKNWTEFVEKPWTMPRPIDQIYLQDVIGPICQQGYSYRQIVPCLRQKQRLKLHYNDTANNTALNITEIALNDRHSFSGWDPQYEHRYNGTPYQSIIQLRTDKISNFYKIQNWDWIAYLHVLQYEQLLWHGTEMLLRGLEAVTNQKAKCNYEQPNTTRLSRYKQRKPFIRYINEHIDWDVEKLVGYYPMNENENYYTTTMGLVP